MHVYDVRRREDHRAFDLVSEVLPFRRLWYKHAADAVDYAKFYSRAENAAIRVYDAAGNLLDTYEHKGDFKEW